MPALAAPIGPFVKHARSVHPPSRRRRRRRHPLTDPHPPTPPPSPSAAFFKPSQAKAVVASGAAALAASLLLAAAPASADFRLPPIDPDPKRCERGFVGNTIGQANAVSDKILDLRQCVYKGADLRAKVLAGALMSDADFSGANLQVRGGGRRGLGGGMEEGGAR